MSSVQPSEELNGMARIKSCARYRQSCADFRLSLSLAARQQAAIQVSHTMLLQKCCMDYLGPRPAKRIARGQQSKMHDVRSTRTRVKQTEGARRGRRLRDFASKCRVEIMSNKTAKVAQASGSVRHAEEQVRKQQFRPVLANALQVKWFARISQLVLSRRADESVSGQSFHELLRHKCWMLSFSCSPKSVNSEQIRKRCSRKPRARINDARSLQQHRRRESLSQNLRFCQKAIL